MPVELVEKCALAMKTSEVKQTLMANTQQALDLGVSRIVELLLTQIYNN